MDLDEPGSLTSFPVRNSIEESVKKRLKGMNFSCDLDQWKIEQENNYSKIKKARRQAILNLARETAIIDPNEGQPMNEVDEEDSKELFGCNLRGEVIERNNYAAKIGIDEYMIKIPEDIVSNW